VLADPLVTHPQRRHLQEPHDILRPARPHPQRRPRFLTPREPRGHTVPLRPRGCRAERAEMRQAALFHVRLQPHHPPPPPPPRPASPHDPRACPRALRPVPPSPSRMTPLRSTPARPSPSPPPAPAIGPAITRSSMG